MKIAVLGAGAWGTALASVLADNGHDVLLWAYEDDVVNDINLRHRNSRYLPNVILHQSIQATHDITKVICDAAYVIESLPVCYMRSTIAQMINCFSKEQIWVITSKGIEQNTLMLPTQIIDDLFGHKTKKVVMAGPSFAQEVVAKKLTGIVIASDDHHLAEQFRALMRNGYFCPEISSDMIGVQLGGALKNVITLGIGMLDGAGFADNAKAFLLTQGLAEMTRLGLKLGAKQETFYGLSGVGDLVLTAMGRFSKNLAIGRQLGQGKSIDQIIKETGYIPEGVNTVQSLHQLMQDVDVDLPVCNGIYDVIFESKPLQYMVSRLIGCSV